MTLLFAISTIITAHPATKLCYGIHGIPHPCTTAELHFQAQATKQKAYCHHLGLDWAGGSDKAWPSCCPVGTKQIGCVLNLPCNCQSIYVSYYQIPHWKHCVQYHASHAACLPKQRPDACPYDSWSAITAFMYGPSNAGDLPANEIRDHSIKLSPTLRHCK